MNKKDKNFYVWTMEECIKNTYEWWGIDMMSMYENIQKDFSSAAEAIQKMYDNLMETGFHKSQALAFERVQYVYEAIANLIPLHEELYFDIRTKEQSKKYKGLNMCSWNRFETINRIDLLMAVLLFTEEFILQPVSGKNVILINSKLTVYGNFVTFKVSKHEDKTYVSIKIRDVMLLEYVILN